MTNYVELEFLRLFLFELHCNCGSSNHFFYKKQHIILGFRFLKLNWRIDPTDSISPSIELEHSKRTGTARETILFLFYFMFFIQKRFTLEFHLLKNLIFSFNKRIPRVKHFCILNLKKFKKPDVFCEFSNSIEGLIESVTINSLIQF